jgi:hypothetical protein
MCTVCVRPRHPAYDGLSSVRPAYTGSSQRITKFGRLKRLLRVPVDWRILGIAAALLALAASNGVAGLWASESRTVPSANGKYLLVLLLPDEERSNRREHDPAMDGPWTEDGIHERHESILTQNEIEGLYSQSGLYRNDRSTTLLWPIGFLESPKDIYVSNDGVHLIVTFLNWDSEDVSNRGNALEFYAHGRQLAVYNEDQLLVGYLARALLSRFAGVAWPTCISAKLDDNSGTFEIATNWGDGFRFDIATGSLIESSLPWAFWTVLIVILFVIALSGWWFWRRIHRQSMQRNKALQLTRQ